AAFEEQYATESGAARSPATEETATIAPRCSSRAPRAACAVVSAPTTLTRCTSTNAAGSTSRSEPGAPPPPAFSTRASSLPNRSTVAATAAPAAEGSAASPGSARQSISAARASSGSRRRPVTATAYPSAASHRAVAAPIPVPPPVTRATPWWVTTRSLPPHSSGPELLQGLEVVDGVAEREAIAAPDPDGCEGVDLLVRRAEELERCAPLPDVGPRAIA